MDGFFNQIDFGPLKQFLDNDDITDISYSEASDGSMMIDNYPEYAKDEKKLTENNIYSKYAVLLDVKNNQILADRNCEQKMYPASMTKLMSLIRLLER